MILRKIQDQKQKYSLHWSGLSHHVTDVLSRPNANTENLNKRGSFHHF